mgnify:CR=1 FL=1
MDIENWDGENRKLATMNYLQAMGNLSMDTYVKIYGELPSYTVLKGMTQEFIKSYHTLGVDSMHLVDGYGLDWIESLLTHNEEVEEYELCTIFRDLIIEYETATKEYLTIS